METLKLYCLQALGWSGSWTQFAGFYLVLNFTTGWRQKEGEDLRRQRLLFNKFSYNLRTTLTLKVNLKIYFLFPKNTSTFDLKLNYGLKLKNWPNFGQNSNLAPTYNSMPPLLEIARGHTHEGMSGKIYEPNASSFHLTVQTNGFHPMVQI